MPKVAMGCRTEVRGSLDNFIALEIISNHIELSGRLYLTKSAVKRNKGTRKPLFDT